MDNLFMGPLSLPENRTEEDQQMWMRLLGAMTHTEVHESSPGVWQYTMTPEPTHRVTESAGSLSAADINALIDQMYDHEVYMPYSMEEMADASMFCMTRSMAHRIRVLSAKAQRYVRARKLKRRQRRAAQRRYNRGMR